MVYSIVKNGQVLESFGSIDEADARIRELAVDDADIANFSVKVIVG